MIEFAASGILGSLLGGTFRLAPEVLKFWDRKSERTHELEMLKIQADLERTKGINALEERYVDYSVVQTEAISSAFKQQGSDAEKSYRWVAALSALVRPAITYTLFGVYVAFKIIVINYAILNGASWNDIALNHWTPDDFAMLNMILTFWFLGRPLEKSKK